MLNFKQYISYDDFYMNYVIIIPTPKKENHSEVI